MPHAKQYATYGNLAPKPPQSNVPPCMEMKDLNHRKRMIMSNALVCIDLFADWCEPCKAVSPKFSKLAQEFNSPGKCLLVKENVDLELTRDCQIRGIPAFIFYLRGKLLRDSQGNPVMVVGGNIEKVREILSNLLKQLN